VATSAGTSIWNLELDDRKLHDVNIAVATARTQKYRKR